MLVIWRSLLAIISLMALLAGPLQANCRQALVLALDVSSSVDDQEYALQMQGLAQALDDQSVRRALTGTGQGHVALMIYEWSGRNQQVEILPWVEMVDNTQVDQAIAALNTHQRSYSGYPTSLGYSMAYAALQLENSPDCGRKTVDVSGDGVNNDGYRPKLAIRNFNFSGVTVNGLVIGSADAGELVQYYRQEVIHGADAFVEVAAGYHDYARAIRRKLLRELTVLALSQAD